MSSQKGWRRRRGTEHGDVPGQRAVPAPLIGLLPRHWRRRRRRRRRRRGRGRHLWAARGRDVAAAPEQALEEARRRGALAGLGYGRPRVLGLGDGRSRLLGELLIVGLLYSATHGHSRGWVAPFDFKGCHTFLLLVTGPF